MSDPTVNKEIAVLSYLAEIQKLLVNDPALADIVADRLDTSAMGSHMRNILLHKRSALSYYNKECADLLKPVLDRIFVTRVAEEFRLDDYPGATLRTLYLKVYQPWLWLIDHDADKAKYAELKRDTKIPQRKTGVYIVFKDSIGTGSYVTHPINLEMTDRLGKLQQKISEFLEEPITADKLFEEKNLSLTEEQVNTIKDSVAGIPKTLAIFLIETDRVRILRRA